MNKFSIMEIAGKTGLSRAALYGRRIHLMTEKEKVDALATMAGDLEKQGRALLEKAAALSGYAYILAIELKYAEKQG